MTAPTIAALPTAPDRASGGTQFNLDATAWAAALADWTTEANDLGAYMETAAAEVAAGLVEGSYPPASDLGLADMDLYTTGGIFTISGSPANMPTGLASLTAILIVTTRFYTGGPAVHQRLLAEVSGALVEYSRYGTGAGPTWPIDWQKHITAADTSSPAENADGTSTDTFPHVAGVREIIAANYLHVCDIKASGVDGGTFISGADQKRTLNSERTSAIAGGGLVWSMAYDAQTVDFTVGQVLTGGTSGATATIVADSDSGATGTLKVIGITGTFADNETITDGAGGSATSNIPSGVTSAAQIYLPAGTYRCEARAPGHRVLTHQAWLYDVTGAAILISGNATFCSTGYDGFTESFISDKFTLATASLLEIRHRCSNTRTADGFGLAAGYAGEERYTDIKFWRL